MKISNNGVNLRAEIIVVGSCGGRGRYGVCTAISTKGEHFLWNIRCKEAQTLVYKCFHCVASSSPIVVQKLMILMPHMAERQIEVFPLTPLVWPR